MRPPKSVSKRDNATAWFVLKVVIICVLMNEALGPFPTLMFLVGWWWGTKEEPSEEEGFY